MTPLVIDGRATCPVPAYPLAGRAREDRPLYVVEQTIHLRTVHGWLRIPRGYVTDFASIPGLATLATLLFLQPLGPWAWAALGHDWGYAIGQPGLRKTFDEGFLERMRVDGVDGFRRSIMYDAVRLGGAGGYDKAATWWATENFADPLTGAYFDPLSKTNPVAPPFRREAAFEGAPWGRRPDPDWPDLALAA